MSKSSHHRAPARKKSFQTLVTLSFHFAPCLRSDLKDEDLCFLFFLGGNADIEPVQFRHQLACFCSRFGWNVGRDLVIVSVALLNHVDSAFSSSSGNVTTMVCDVIDQIMDIICD